MAVRARLTESVSDPGFQAFGTCGTLSGRMWPPLVTPSLPVACGSGAHYAGWLPTRLAAEAAETFAFAMVDSSGANATSRAGQAPGLPATAAPESVREVG